MTAAARAVSGGGSRGGERRCLVTRQVTGRDRLLRFVQAPDGRVVPDLDERLPGRGMWLSADRNVLDRAVARRLFARAAGAPVQTGTDLADRVERLLTRRALDTLGLARRAGGVAVGFEQVRARLRDGEGGVLIEAADGAADGRRKLRALAPTLPVITVLTRAELGAAVGRDDVVHLWVAAGALADRLLRDATRLAGLRVGEAAMPYDVSTSETREIIRPR